MYSTDSRADQPDESCNTKPLHLPSPVGREYDAQWYFSRESFISIGPT